MQIKLGRLIFLSLLLLAALVLPATAQQFERAQLEIINQRSKASVFLQVELAYTEEERMQGLMYRNHVPQDEGMFFDLQENQVIYMWMKNTPIALDMFFADNEGLIFHVERNTTPLSLKTISSGRPGRYVLEIPAGGAERLGIKPGDRIVIPQKDREKELQKNRAISKKGASGS